MAALTQTLTDSTGATDLLAVEMAYSLADAGMGLTDAASGSLVALTSTISDDAGLTDSVLVEFLVIMADNGLGMTDAGDGRNVAETVTDTEGGTDDLVAVYPPGDAVEPTVDYPGFVLDSSTLAGGLTWLYGLQEGSGSVTAGDVSGAPGRPTLTLTRTGDVGTVESGSSGIMPEGTALRFAPEAVEGGGWGGYTMGSPDVASYLTGCSVWLAFAWSGAVGCRLLRLGDGTAGLSVSVTPSQVVATLTTATGATSTRTLTVTTNDNRPHFAVVTVAQGSIVLTVDTAQASAPAVAVGSVTGLTLGAVTSGDAHQLAWVGYSNAPMTAAAALDLANLGSGGSERSDQRIARICRWLGLESDLVADVGLSDVAYTATGEAQALDVIRDVNGVESGTFFVAGDGTFRQHSRSRRYDAPVRLVLPALHVSPDTAVDVDLSAVVNDVSVSRPGGATYRARNETSIQSPTGQRSKSLTIYAASDNDLRSAAQWMVHRYGEPRPRVSSITVDLMTTSAELASAVLSLEIGDRIQVTGMPSTTPGGTTVDLFIEGVDGGTVTATAWTVAMTTSPVFDPVGLLDSGLLGTMTLAY